MLYSKNHHHHFNQFKNSSIHKFCYILNSLQLLNVSYICIVCIVYLFFFRCVKPLKLIISISVLILTGSLVKTLAQITTDGTTSSFAFVILVHGFQEFGFGFSIGVLKLAEIRFFVFNLKNKLSISV